MGTLEFFNVSHNHESDLRYRESNPYWEEKYREVALLALNKYFGKQFSDEELMVIATVAAHLNHYSVQEQLDFFDWLYTRCDNLEISPYKVMLTATSTRHQVDPKILSRPEGRAIVDTYSHFLEVGHQIMINFEVPADGKSLLAKQFEAEVKSNPDDVYFDDPDLAERLISGEFTTEDLIATGSMDAHSDELKQIYLTGNPDEHVAKNYTLAATIIKINRKRDAEAIEIVIQTLNGSAYTIHELDIKSIYPIGVDEKLYAKNLERTDFHIGAKVSLGIPYEGSNINTITATGTITMIEAPVGFISAIVRIDSGYIDFPIEYDEYRRDSTGLMMFNKVVKSKFCRGTGLPRRLKNLQLITPES